MFVRKRLLQRFGFIEEFSDVFITVNTNLALLKVEMAVSIPRMYYVTVLHALELVTI